MGHWFAYLPHSSEVLSLNLGSAPPLWSLHVLSPCACMCFSLCSGFHPQLKNVHVRFIEDSALSVRVNVSVCLNVPSDWLVTSLKYTLPPAQKSPGMSLQVIREHHEDKYRKCMD